MYGYDASYAVDEQLGDAALAALSIVGVSILPVILLSLTIEKSRHGHIQGQGD
jgi:ABC-type Fe3+ transport system permease subunit